MNDDFTWAFWAFCQPSGNVAGTVLLGYRGPGPLQFIRFVDSNFEYFTGPDQIFMPYTPRVSQWDHLCVVKSGAKLTYYANGVVVTTATVTADEPSVPIYLGGDPTNFVSTEYFNGSLDDVRLYTRALSASEVASLVAEKGTSAATLAPVKVAVLDANGTLVASATDSITIALGTNPGGGTVTGTTTVKAVNGNCDLHGPRDRQARDRLHARRDRCGDVADGERHVQCDSTVAAVSSPTRMSSPSPLSSNPLGPTL